MLQSSTPKGVLYALGAGLVWGLVFVAPLILADYPPALLAFGRYLAFGLVCLPLAWQDRRRLAMLKRRDWLVALELSLSGNILYYLSLAAAIQLADGPLPTLIIGTLPVVIAVVSNFRDHPLPWHRLAPSLVIILTGLFLVHSHDPHLATQTAGSSALSLILAVAALICWTWYPIRNARWLRLRPELAPSTWATAQGLTTLPLSLLGVLLTGKWFSLTGRFEFPLGPRPSQYISLMLAIGLLASWLGTLLWNCASRQLPTALAGQLIVFETVAALTYTFIWLGHYPALPVAAGILLLICGVILGVRTFQRCSPMP